MINLLFKKPFVRKTPQGFSIVENVFSLKERRLMKKQLCPLVQYRGSNFPGLQSDPDIHHLVKSSGFFNFYTKLFDILYGYNQSKTVGVVKSWVNLQDKNTVPVWHTHPGSDYTCVYYLVNPEKIGTVIDYNNKIFQYEMKENSLLILPSTVRHSAPVVKKERFTVAIDYIEM